MSKMFMQAKVDTYHVQHLEGQLLTVVDASIQDAEQRKAVKDLVSGTLWQWFTYHGGPGTAFNPAPPPLETATKGKVA